MGGTLLEDDTLREAKCLLEEDTLVEDDTLLEVKPLLEVESMWFAVCGLLFGALCVFLAKRLERPRSFANKRPCLKASQAGWKQGSF